MACCVEITNGASNGGGAAAAWSAVLAVGNVSGGTDAVIDPTDELRGVDESGSGTGPAGVLFMQGGSHSGTTAGDDGGATTVAGGDAGLGGASFSVGGDMTVRGGDLFSTGSQRGGNLVVRSGAGNLASTAVFSAGDVDTGNPGGLATLHGGDNIDTGIGGDLLVRGGDALVGAGNDAGGDTAITGGRARNIANGGDMIVRSGVPTTSSSSGALRITTNVPTSLGPSLGGGNAFSVSGNVQIDTIGIGATGASSGNINLQTDNIPAGATGSTGPGDITMTAGNLANTGQSFIGGGSFAFTAGSNAGATSAPAGDFVVTCGAQTGTGAQANSPGGSFSVLAGASAHNNALSGGGDLILTAGGSSSVNGPGGDADITAGDITNAAAVGPAGVVTLTAGSVTNAGSAANGGNILLNPGTAAGAGVDGRTECSTDLICNSGSPTFTVGDQTGTPVIQLDKLDAGSTLIDLRNAGVLRWRIAMEGDEDLTFGRFSAAGAFQDNALEIVTGGDIFMANRLGVTGADPASADAAADDFVIGQVALANTGLTILGLVGTIAFGDAALADAGRQTYTHSSNRMTWIVNNNARMRLAGVALTPNAVGGTSLGNDAIPWGNVFHQSQNVATQTTAAGNVTLDATDYFLTVTGGGTTTLPASGVATEGRVYAIANKQLAATALVDTTGADTINGAASVTIGSAAVAFFILEGTDWVSWEAANTT